jgi:arginine deiminase
MKSSGMSSFSPFADSTYGQLRAALVCPPHPEQAVKVFKDPDRALVQHRILVDILLRQGVQCYEMEADPDLPYQCYMRDSLTVTPWGVLLCKMGFQKRGLEPERVSNFLKSRDIPVWKAVDNGSFEGGDLHLIRPGIAVLGFNSGRSSLAGAQQILGWFKDKGWDCRILPYCEGVVHLDVVFSVLSPTRLLVGQNALEPVDRRWFQALGYTLYDVDPLYLRTLPCNLLMLDSDRLLIPANNPEIRLFLQRLGYDVLEADISEFIHDEGGVHCLVQALHRTSVSE